MAGLIVKRLNGCARCHGDGHDDLTFLPLTHVVECDCGETFTHWAPCPTNGEPILLGHRSRDAEGRVRA